MRTSPMKGARVLITGAGGGIGRLMAIEAARRGAKAVAIWDINEETAAETAQLVAAEGAEGRYWKVDVTSTEQVETAAKDVLDRLGRIDILINNAGVVTGHKFMEITEESLKRTYDINCLALYRVTQQFLPGMLKRDRGAVAVVASAAGLVGVPRQTDYSAQKFAATGFTESLRAELRHDGSHVKTLLIQPYYIDTGMFEGVRTKFSFLLPILQPIDVATRAIAALEAGKEELVMPPFVQSIKPMKILPTPLRDWLTDFFGVSSTMDDFVGHGK